MKKSIIILGITALVVSSCGGQTTNNKQISNMNETNNDESKYLCILEETKGTIIFLTGLRLADDGQKFSAGGNEIVLNFGIWKASKIEDIYKNGVEHSGMLRIVPERIATEDGGSYDTAAIYLFTWVYAFYENGVSTGHGEPSGKWVSVGLASDNSIYAKILDYFDKNQTEIENANQ